MDQGALLIRADASTAMGTGHVMRCLALAQAWRDAGGQCVFAMAESTAALERRLIDEKMEIAQLTAGVATEEDATQTAEIAARKNAVWVAVDGYQFGSAYQRSIKAGGFKLLFVDDNLHAENYCADLVLNQNLHAKASLYAQRESYTHLLLGPRYAMLRREFRPWRNWQREIPATGLKILITMGGSDPENLTLTAIDALQQLAHPNHEAVVLVGGSNPQLRSLEKSMRSRSIRLIVDAANVPEHMSWADVAVAGAGTTFWEICFLGLPSILLTLADNQKGVAAAAEKTGIAYNLGKGTNVSASSIAARLRDLLNSSEIRASQSAKGRNLVDGRGADRVVAFLSGLQLRSTVESDCELFWEWANDPGARAASFRNKTISWEHHVKWFQAKMMDPNAVLYTATDRDGLPMGEVRYQIESARAVLSISVGARFRGCRCGQKILTIALDKLSRDSEIRFPEVQFIDAYVKPTNEASLKLFAAAGFQRASPAVIEGQAAVHFVLEKSGFA